MRTLINNPTNAGPIEGLYVGDTDVVVLFQGNTAMWVKAGTTSDDEPCMDVVHPGWDMKYLLSGASHSFLQNSGLCSVEEVQQMREREAAAARARIERAERAELNRLLRKYGATPDQPSKE